MNQPAMPPPKPPPPAFLAWLPWEKMTIWGLFILVMYALRHFFALMFVTFILTYIMRTLVVTLAGVVQPKRNGVWVERLLTVVLFALLLLGGYGIGAYLGPQLMAQGEALVLRITRIQPEEEFNNIMSRTIGAYLLEREYGGPSDPRFRRAFEEFQRQNQVSDAYEKFPALQASIEGPFDATIQEEEAERIDTEIGQSGPIDREFRAWFLAAKAPLLYKKNRKQRIQEWEARNRPPEATGEAEGEADAGPRPPDPSEDPDFEKKRDEQIRLAILDEVYRDAEQRAKYAEEWKAHRLDALSQELKDKETSEHADRFADYYRERHKTDPAGFPYTFELYQRLKVASEAGEEAFAAVARELHTGTQEERLEKARQEFQVSLQNRLAQDWMTGPVATRLREVLETYTETGFKSLGTGLTESVGALAKFAGQLVLSVLLGFFITFDIPRLSKAVKRLEHSRFSRFYLEIAPGLNNLGRLMGRAFQAQGMIALINTGLTFIAISYLDIQNAVFLCAIVFACSFIPVLGVVISSVPIAVMALVQPGGTLWLAIQAIAAIIIIHFVETSLLNPKILGDMLHLHPVLVLAVLAIGEHFFGVWGLLLGVPITVYFIRFVIFDDGIPGFIEPQRAPRPEPPT